MILKELSGKRGEDDPSTPFLKKFCSQWAAMASAGSVLLSGNVAVRTALDDLATFFQNGGVITLKTMIQQRKKLLEADRNLEDLAPKLQEMDLGELVTVRLPEAWASELSAQSFDDAASWQAARYVTDLAELTAQRARVQAEALQKKAQEHNIEILDYFHELAFNGDRRWSKNLPEVAGDSWEEMYKFAKDNLFLYLSSTSITSYLEKFDQASWLLGPAIAAALEVMAKPCIS